MSNAINMKGKSHSFDARFSLKRMFRSLDKLQDVVVFCCGALLVFKMMLVLTDTFLGLQAGMDLKQITAQSMFILILVELFRLVAVYLKHHRIYVGIAVEVAVVSVLREIIIEGVIHMDGGHIAAIGAFLLVMGGLMLISYKVEGTVDH